MRSTYYTNSALSQAGQGYASFRSIIMKKGLYIDGLTFSFPQSTQPFFENLSLHCPAGKLYFIQGKNGSGKSTLLRIIQGSLMPGERLIGTFHLDSKPITIHANRVPRHFTYKIKTVVQDTDTMLADQFTVEQNLQCAQLPPTPGLGQLPTAQSLPLLMQEFGIKGSTEVKQLSGGQRQILAIIMALQKPTAVLLLDEPTAALDPRNASMIMDFLQKLASTHHITILIISHDKELVTTYSAGSYFELHEESTGIRAMRTIKSSLLDSNCPV